jgi:hypothetical protein
MTYDRINFVNIVKAVVDVLGIVSRLFHSFSFIIICAMWFINILSVIQIYCFSNDVYANCPPRELMMRGSASKTADDKIRVRAPDFRSRACWCDPEGSHASTFSGPCSYRRQYAHRKNQSRGWGFAVWSRAIRCPGMSTSSHYYCSAGFDPVTKNSHQGVGGSVRNGNW